jgi:hypothetical protein
LYQSPTTNEINNQAIREIHEIRGPMPLPRFLLCRARDQGEFKAIQGGSNSIQPIQTSTLMYSILAFDGQHGPSLYFTR